MVKTPRIFIATPAYGGMLHVTYVMGLLQLYAGLSARGQNPIVHFIADESLIPRARNDALAEFRKSDADVLVMLDADIGFMPETIAILVASRLPVVGAAYPRKIIEGGFVLDAHPDHVAANQYPTLDAGAARFIEVRHAGTGLLVVTREAVEKLIATYPERAYKSDAINKTHGEERWDLFPTGVDPESRRYLSEDWGFCDLWRRAGGKVWVLIDAPLTHTGPHTFAGNFSDLFTAKSKGGT